MVDAKKRRLSIAELEQTDEYARLTEQQRLFVATYCEGGLADGHYDKTSAAATAYPRCKSRNVARVMAYALMQNINVIAALNRHFQRSPIEEFLEEVTRAISNKRLSVAQFNALKLKGDILGYTVKLPGTANFPQGTIPNSVIEEQKEARRAARKKTTKVSSAAAPQKPWDDF